MERFDSVPYMVPDRIRYDKKYLTRAEKLTESQLNLAHGPKMQKK